MYFNQCTWGKKGSKMTGGFTFWDTQTWSFVVTLSVLFGAMLLASLVGWLLSRRGEK